MLPAPAVISAACNWREWHPWSGLPSQVAGHVGISYFPSNLRSRSLDPRMLSRVCQSTFCNGQLGGVDGAGHCGYGAPPSMPYGVGAPAGYGSHVHPAHHNTITTHQVQHMHLSVTVPFLRHTKSHERFRAVYVAQLSQGQMHSTCVRLQRKHQSVTSLPPCNYTVLQPAEFQLLLSSTGVSNVRDLGTFGA